MSSTWVIGDVHGCAKTLEALLERLTLDRRRDRLVLAGDLVNRGPRSLEALRLAVGLAEEFDSRFEMVLGNHDLHLLALAAGISQSRRGDTLAAVLGAPDCRELLSWLRQRPLVAEVGGALVVHAGLDPGWGWDQVWARSRDLSKQIADPHRVGLLARSASPDRDQRDLAIFTRLRTWDVHQDQPNFDFSGAPEEAGPSLVPWYQASTSRPPRPVAFGHWAAHGFRLIDGGRVIALDSGCAWGGRLTAVRLEDLRVVAEPLRDRA